MARGKGSKTTAQRTVGQQPEGEQKTEHFLKRNKARKNRVPMQQTVFNVTIIGMFFFYHTSVTNTPSLVIANAMLITHDKVLQFK